MNIQLWHISLVLTILKIVGVLNIPWLLVLLPIFLPIMFSAAVLMFFTAVMILVYITAFIIAFFNGSKRV